MDKLAQLPALLQIDSIIAILDFVFRMDIYGMSNASVNTFLLYCVMMFEVSLIRFSSAC